MLIYHPGGMKNRPVGACNSEMYESHPIDMIMIIITIIYIKHIIYIYIYIFLYISTLW
jgi:hypothetical protein